MSVQYCSMSSDGFPVYWQVIQGCLACKECLEQMDLRGRPGLKERQALQERTARMELLMASSHGTSVHGRTSIWAQTTASLL